MSDTYILDGHTPVPCDDLLVWAAWLETAERHVAQTELAEGVRISTIFLGLDHSFEQGPPILFESMVFGGTQDGRQNRYHTWEEAEAGHAVIVEQVRTALEALR